MLTEAGSGVTERWRREVILSGEARLWFQSDRSVHLIKVISSGATGH